MNGWKKALVAGSVGSAAILFLKKRPTAGAFAASVGLAVLASEYPETFQDVRNALPDYFQGALRLLEMASRAGRRIAEIAERQGRHVWSEIESY
jgi:hypothetical protein